MEEKRRSNYSGNSKNQSVRSSTGAKRSSGTSSGRSSQNRTRSSSYNGSRSVKSTGTKTIHSKKVSSEKRSGRNTYVGKNKSNLNRYNMIYYVIMVIIVLIVAFAVCFGILFKADNISIEGNVTKYTDDKIISAGGLSYGKVLAGINTDKVEEKIENSLAYIETAEVKKKYPTTLIINVTEAKPTSVVEYNKVQYIISDSYKVVDILGGDIPEDLILIKNMNATECTVGKKIQFENEDFAVNLDRLLKSFAKQEFTVRAIEVDEAGYFKANYDQRIIIDFGNISDVDHKVKLAKKIISDEISPNEKGILYLSQDNQSSFRADNGNLRINYAINQN